MLQSVLTDITTIKGLVGGLKEHDLKQWQALDIASQEIANYDLASTPLVAIRNGFIKLVNSYSSQFQTLMKSSREINNYNNGLLKDILKYSESVLISLQSLATETNVNCDSTPNAALTAGLAGLSTFVVCIKTLNFSYELLPRLPQNYRGAMRTIKTVPYLIAHQDTLEETKSFTKFLKQQTGHQ